MRRIWRRLCHAASQRRDTLAQGIPLVLCLASLLLTVAPAAQAAKPATPGCGGPAWAFEPLGDGLWRLPARPGEADAANRGQVSNLLLARDGGVLWALGSGPSPAFGRALACQARRALGLPIRHAISPWTRPEAVLGVAGLGNVQHHAHQDVATGMAASCPTCVARLRQRLGAAASDLGAQPIRLPEQRLQGDSGRLGPWQWWRLPRSTSRVTTLWRWQGGAGSVPLWFAPGQLWGDGVPDAREADVLMLLQAAGRMVALNAPDGASARWLGEQGPVLDAGAPARLAGYWEALTVAVRRAIDAGTPEAAPAPPLDGVPAAWTNHPWHALNWQRAWRQLEEAAFEPPVR